MSTELAVIFGKKHYEKYAEVLDAWANTAAGEKITEAMVQKWGADLHDALSEDLMKALLAKDDLSSWSSKGITLPSPETLKMFSQIAVKYSLQYATRDLLDRLIKSTTFDKENPPEVITSSANSVLLWSGPLNTTSNTTSALTAAIKPMRPTELAKRSPQTVAQIFDMAKDKYTRVLTNHLVRTNQFTGRRRWETAEKTSRHAELNGEIKDFNEKFIYNKEKVVGPRPVGGSPAHWSNCSCRLTYELKNGRWVG